MTEGAADFSKTSKSEEQYTPREWWQRVIMVMGRIDVDPSADLEKRIPAGTHYTKIDNGLTKPWIGTVYNNPPFGHGVGQWFTKLGYEINKGNCTEAIICWKAALETRATKTLISIPTYRMSAVPNNRISFLCGDDTQTKRNAGDVANFTPIFHYFGPHEGKFARIFGPHSTLWRPVKVTENQNLIEDLL